MDEEKESHERAVKAVEAIFERYLLIHASLPSTNTTPAFDLYTMKNLKLTSATSTPKSTVTYELLISDVYANVNGVMHGGAAGVIFDMATTTALGPISRKGFWDFMGGVTRSLSLAYLKAIPIGTSVRIHSEVVQVGRTMAMILGRMESLDGKTVYCTCEHHKVAVPTQEAHYGFRVGWDDLWDKESAEPIKKGTDTDSEKKVIKANL